MKFKVAAIFSDNMVLQRNKPIAVFGQGKDGSKIHISLKYPEADTYKEVYTEAVVSEEKWIGYLPEMKENTACIMTVSDGENIKEFKNIAIGEVWMCGGQSNMEFELDKITGGTKHLSEDKPNVRFYYTQKRTHIDEEFYKAEEATGWEEFDSEKGKRWSGVGYLFALRLSEALNITVGLVGCNWGGTSASAWMSREFLASDEDTNSYLADYEKATEGKTIEQQIKEYDEYLVYEEWWNKKCDECYATIPGITWDEVQEKIGVCKWPGPMGCHNPFRPNGAYETMIKRIVPYTMQGFLYYQGESDDHKPHMYDKLLSMLIKQWRYDWKDENMAFLLVQLPGHMYETCEDLKNWCVIREAQEDVASNVHGAGMAVIIDAGEFNDIHPKDKEPVGERLYRQAMLKVYGNENEEWAMSPLYKSHTVKDDKIIVNFKYVTKGLKKRYEDMDVVGFEVAGNDDIYYDAKAYIDGNSVVVFSEFVKEPVNVRYMWTNYPKDGVNLYNNYDLPVAPFRSNRQYDKTTYEIKIQQIMEL